MPARTRSRLGKLPGLLLLILVCAGGAYWYFKHSATGESSPPTEQELAKKVEMLTMRNVRQYYVDNEKVGKVFVIEGKVVNEFPEPKELVTVEAAIYERTKKRWPPKDSSAACSFLFFCCR